MQSVNNEVQPLCNGDYLAEVLRLFLQWKLGFEQETVLYSLIKVQTANIIRLYFVRLKKMNLVNANVAQW